MIAHCNQHFLSARLTCSEIGPRLVSVPSLLGNMEGLCSKMG